AETRPADAGVVGVEVALRHADGVQAAAVGPDGSRISGPGNCRQAQRQARHRHELPHAASSTNLDVAGGADPADGNACERRASSAPADLTRPPPRRAPPPGAARSNESTGFR